MLSRFFVLVQFNNKSYLLSERKLLLAGDIELNEGPRTVDSCAHRTPILTSCGGLRVLAALLVCALFLGCTICYVLLYRFLVLRTVFKK